MTTLFEESTGMNGEKTAEMLQQAAPPGFRKKAEGIFI